MNFFAAFLALALAQPPTPGAPLNVAVTPERVELGRKLFYDPRLSIDGTVSCATCHRADHGFAEPQSVSIGVRGLRGTRNAPTVIGATYLPNQFWDGNTLGHAQQSLGPLVNPVEMANGSVQQVVNRVNSIRGYRSLFLAAYGQPCNAARLGHAIASFENSVLSFDAPVDKRMAGYTRALSSQAEAGFQLFMGLRPNRAGITLKCNECHTYPLMTDGKFHNTGIAFFSNTGDRLRGGFLRGQATAADIRAAKTPTLREISRTPPYMHAGTILDLAAVIDGYNAGWSIGGRVDRNQDPRIGLLGLDDEEQAQLEAFLREGLSSPTYPRITAPGLPR
jgi:cytochrome c peroxidase